MKNSLYCYERDFMSDLQISMHTVDHQMGSVAQWLWRLTCKREIVGSNPTLGSNFSFCNSYLFCVIHSQLYYVNTNEINHNIHLANILFL